MHSYWTFLPCSPLLVYPHVVCTPGGGRESTVGWPVDCDPIAWPFSGLREGWLPTIRGPVISAYVAERFGMSPLRVAIFWPALACIICVVARSLQSWGILLAMDLEVRLAAYLSLTVLPTHSFLTESSFLACI